MIAASLMSGLSNSKFRRSQLLINRHFMATFTHFFSASVQVSGLISLEEQMCPSWALPAGLCQRGLATKTTHTSEVTGRKVFTTSVASAQTTTETLVQGWKVLRLENLVLKTSPKLPLGRRRRMCAEVPGPLTSANSWSVFAMSVVEISKQ